MAEETLTVYVAPLSTYEDEELAAAAGSTSAALTELFPDNADAQEFAADLKEGRDRMFAAGVKDLANPETGNKLDADANRDRRFLGFRSKVEHLSYNEDQAVAEAASAILDRIRQRGYSLHAEGQKKQTVLLDGLILDMNEQPFQKMMSTIGVTPEFTAMVQAENMYIRTVENHTRAGAAIVNPSLVAARKFVCKNIAECNTWLERRFRKLPAEMTPIVLRWNEIFSKLTAEARARGTRKSNETAKTTTAAIAG